MFKKFLSKKNKYYGFTLVELIIVITILAILATIAFVSFSGYTGNSRDSNRLFSIKEISKSLTIQKELTGNYPVPDSIYATGGITALNPNLFNVGIIGKGVSNYIKLGSIPLDPKSKNEYSYGLTKDNKYFQVAGTLENGEVLGYKLVNQTYAAGLSTAVVEGNYKGLIKFSTGGTNYIGNIPSLIYSRDGTYSGSDKEFVINKGTNVPYLVGGNVGELLDESKIVKEYYGTGTSIKTEIIDPSTITKEDIKIISNKLGVSELEIAQVVDKKELIDYYASITSSGGSNSNNGSSSCPTNPNPDSDFTFDMENKTITSYKGTSTEVKIPCKIGGVNVEKIGMFAFGSKLLTSVELPNTLKVIGDYAFYNNKISIIEIPNSVTYIGNFGLSKNLLKSIIVPNLVTSIGDYSFSENQITSLVISDKLEILGNYSFYKNQLQVIVLPNSLTYVGNYAFYDNKLSSITFGSGLNFIGESTFSNNQLTSIVIPDSIKNIGSYSFQMNKLNSVTIPNSVTSIGTSAFVKNGVTQDSTSISDWISGNGGVWNLNGKNWVKQ